MEIENILYPTDFSEPAHTALPHALEIARRYHANLTVLHVRTPHADDPNRPEYQFLDQGRYEEYVKRNLSELSEAVESCHTVTTALARDFNPASGILEFIESNQIDLTVMGTHGRSALAHFFLGSVAEQIVRSSPTPVLTIAARDGYSSKPDYENILVAFDFSEHSRKAVRQAARLAQHYQARLLGLYVIEQEIPPAYYGIWKNALTQDLPRIESKVRDSLREAGEGRFEEGDVYVKIGEGRAYREISEFAAAHRVDLIVMGTHGRSGLELMLLGSTTERVIRIACCPVLTLKLNGH